MIKNRSTVAARFMAGASFAFIVATPIYGIWQPCIDQGRANGAGEIVRLDRPANLLAGTWRDDLRFLLETAIALMEGTGGSTTLDPADDAETWMSTLTDVYANEGIRQSMTGQEKSDLLDSIDDSDLHLDSAPSSVDTGAVADCETLLDDMRAELLGTSL